jgi:hypothetical protein
MREHWHSVNTGTGAPGSKTPKNVEKFQKLQFKLDNNAEYDGVGSNQLMKPIKRGVNQV